ncbi:rhodanese-like domain-containing protein [Ligilactobacillus sp. WILCCON 0076]|uniref:Rhodanese-like domain-containing protein n=1 Tax=Ligilactobacillus ubinensis TaxID=2876789 RepID=A0A9X2FK66_9LACO|nr:rhodanese-like domain-containing protein [Ligilactobacillus ubinensis]MCP0887126.1 rhodanese-like domain-containing protein [Ligilactobacillus ubinensis]
MFKSISMQDFFQKYNNNRLTVIDVRESDEFAFGHIPHATNLPLSELAEKYQSLAKDKEYYVVCQSGSRSAYACQFLSSNGFNVVNINGGTSAWLGELVR